MLGLAGPVPPKRLGTDSPCIPWSQPLGTFFLGLGCLAGAVTASVSLGGTPEAGRCRCSFGKCC